MVHLRCDFFSEALSLSTSMTVLLPQRTTTQIGMEGATSDGPPPVLYLLHGLSDDDTIWLRRTSIERYAAPLGLAVVMPQVHRSFYTDQAYGGRYWSFLSEELPELVGSLFRVSDRREDTFVAGLSMGGYGALKWALRQPERFAAAASLSGAVDVAGLRTGRERPEDPRMFERIFGNRGPTAEDDLRRLLEGADVDDLPALYICCGTEDMLIEDNVAFRDELVAAGAKVAADFGPGDHDWAYWDDRIQDVLAWLPLDTRA
ncbi:esterase family protein [Blastococcus sp. CT_GayMR19]|uniref:alpha/beta hydrolase n=1 Tax=Blastococcus sp. CT_GayMR19 TaxID=2559608 RepID=UPI001073117E|nr:alpha/beta hydrolase family protein [Blastococcus sp. CT_GayMR19]TFV75448.1 esterase family protein [Blastococcus sp. CT_GayMR19]